MGSAKQGYPVVSAACSASVPAATRRPTRLPRRCSTTSCARRVHAVERLTPTIVEVVVRAPLAARAFQPGQFYRLQNFETLAPRDRRHARSRWKASR